MHKTAQWRTVAFLATAFLFGCGDSSTADMTEPVTSTPASPGPGTAASTKPSSGSSSASAGTGAAAVSGSAGSPGATKKAPIVPAEKCPKLAQVAGITSTPCCLSDNTCGIDGSSLNRGCLSYTELKKFFSFATPQESMCDGTPIPGSAPSGAAGMAAGAGAAGMSARAGAGAAAGSNASTSNSAAGMSGSAGAAGR